jgi:predicted ATP-binding protein involved in virulence
MRITSLVAIDVFGHMNLTVEFLPDLTFLVGPNGSGKTTALRLLMALLTPAIEELISIRFSQASVEVEIDGKPTFIIAEWHEGNLQIHVRSEELGPECRLSLSPQEQELITSRRKEKAEHPYERMINKHPVFQKIVHLSTPVFLGIERHYNRSVGSNLISRSRSGWDLNPDFETITAATSIRQHNLNDAQALVHNSLREIRRKREQLDEGMRRTLLISALQITTVSLETTRIELGQLNFYLASAERMLEALEFLKLPPRNIRDFSASIRKFIEDIEEMRRQVIDVPDQPHEEKSSAIFKLLLNISQLDRIKNLINEIEPYNKERESYNEPIARLLRLLNDFFKQTGKAILINEKDRLVVRSSGRPETALTALSSGERQLCTMLTCLALSPELRKSGVFIVDEPELSLHLAWQELFVSAVRDANPDVQLIFATHSPAIIMYKHQHCRKVDFVANR